MIGKILSIICCFLLMGYSSQSADETTPEADAYNNYIQYINESTHGLLIVHRLLENFNLDINKYVDLESYQINFYSNRDLPKDIFRDPEQWFYDISPYKWYAKTYNNKTPIDPNKRKKLDADAAFILDLIGEVNEKRFNIEKLINSLDLKDNDQLKKVYDELESCVDLYEKFFSAQQRMEKELFSVEVEEPEYYRALEVLYRDFRATLLAIRKKDKKRTRLLTKKLRTTVQTLNLASLPRNLANKPSVKFHIDNIKSQAKRGLEACEKYVSEVVVPKDYEMYGDHYYYYNSDAINKFNRYGSGIVFEMNQLLKELDYEGLLFTELPHYYKVIYPRKLEELKAVEPTNTETITALPRELEGRKLMKKESGAIKVDKEVVEVEVFDHMIQDGDIVSLNFNGEWVLRRHRLTSEPVKLKLKLNKDGKNFLVLHAENLGQRPPNTLAVRYYSGGKRQLYVMNSDLNKSEMIEIVGGN